MHTTARRIFKLIDFVVLLALLLSGPMTAVQAYVATDQSDYSPGSVVTIYGDNRDGAGYLPGETVHVDVVGPNGYTAACDGEADEIGAWSCQVTLWDSPLAVGDYSYTATGLLSGFTEGGTFTDAAGDISKVYQHWSDTDVEWNNNILNDAKSDYFEGEVIPHVFVYKASSQVPLTNGESYSFNITYNYYQQNTNAGGFAYITTYNTSRQPGPLGATTPYIQPTEDASFTNGGGIQGSFYTVDADITEVSTVTYQPTGTKDGYVTVTFTYTGTTTTNGIAEVYFGLYIANPGQVPDQGAGPTNGANAWTGGSLQTTIDIGGSGATSIQMSPDAIIAGQISGLKFHDQDGDGVKDDTEPVITGWTIVLDTDTDYSNGYLMTALTDASGNYTFSVTPDADKSDLDNDPYYVYEVQQNGWLQTAPSTVFYGPLVVSSLTPQYINQNFGNQQGLPSIDVEKYVSVDGGTTWEDADAAPGPLMLSSGTNPQFKFVVTNTGNVALDQCEPDRYRYRQFLPERSGLRLRYSHYPGCGRHLYLLCITTLGSWTTYRHRYGIRFIWRFELQ